ncbi:MAG: YceI family protein [Rhizobacter sp.]
MPLITLSRCICAQKRVGAHVGAHVGVCLLAWQSFSAQAQGVTYTLDPAHTHVHWEVLHFGTSTSRGRFDEVSGSLKLDAAARTGEVSVAITTTSVNTGVGPLNSVLRSSYLATTEFPQAYFVASGWRWTAEAPLEVRGELTLHGVSRALVLRAPLLHCDTQPLLKREVCGADLEGELQRSDFGITDGLPFIANRVRLVIQVEAIRDEAR